MDELKELLEYKDYGCIEISLEKIMKDRDISAYAIGNKSNISYKTIKRLMENKDIDRVDLDVLAKLCYMFDCDLSDIMRYKKPKKNK